MKQVTSPLIHWMSKEVKETIRKEETTKEMLDSGCGEEMVFWAACIVYKKSQRRMTASVLTGFVLS